MEKKEIQERYRRKKGIGIKYPCSFCGTKTKRVGFPHFCSDKCRFEAKIDKQENGCWIWKSSKGNSGYGKFHIRGKPMLTHRYSYELYKGSIPKGMCICHSCDNKLCVNPDHLWIGTQKDNAQDAKKKGLLPNLKGLKKPQSFIGQNHHSSKLKNEDVFRIRQLYREGTSGYRLHKIYNVTKKCISDILNNKTWKHLND